MVMPRTVSLPQHSSPGRPVAEALLMFLAVHTLMVSPSVASSQLYEELVVIGELSFELQIGPSVIDMRVFDIGIYQRPPSFSK